MTAPTRSVLALDVGASRIGVAIASLETLLPRPLTTIDNNDQFIPKLSEIIHEEAVSEIAVGLPRGLDGQSTGQTAMVEDFIVMLQKHIELPLHFQDEALTSKQAEQELDKRGKPYARGDIDALAATYILEDWLIDYKGQLDA